MRVLLLCAGLGLATWGLVDLNDRGPTRAGTHAWVVSAWKEHDDRKDRGRLTLPVGVAMAAAGAFLNTKRAPTREG